MKCTREECKGDEDEGRVREELRERGGGHLDHPRVRHATRGRRGGRREQRVEGGAKKMSSYTFIIVGKNDNPIYEAEFSSGQKVRPLSFPLLIPPLPPLPLPSISPS